MALFIENLINYWQGHRLAAVLTWLSDGAFSLKANKYLHYSMIMPNFAIVS